MDWEGISTAILDRERARLGLPTRETERMTREKRAEEAAAAASRLDTEGIIREKTRMDIETQPELRRLQGEAAVARAEAAQALADRDPRPLAPHYATDKSGRVRAIRLVDGKYVTEDLGNIGVPQREPQPQTVVVQTVDPQGNPITKIVPKTAGSEFAKPLPATMQQAQGVAGALSKGLAEMEQLANDPNVATGFIEGNLSKGIKAFTGPDTNPDDPSYSDPEYKLDFLGNQMVDLVYQKSGKQINQQEMAILRQMIPNRGKGNLPEQVRLWKEYANNVLARYNTSLDAPDAPGGGAAPAAAAAPTRAQAPTGAPVTAPVPARKRYNPQTGRVE